MGQVLHGSACTTEAVRRAIQRSEESVSAHNVVTDEASATNKIQEIDS